MDAWLGVFAFAGHIFFEFCRLFHLCNGIAACLGFTLPDNFRYPYAAYRIF
jgi:alginate O-acetyltransferase complex protein AlgI